MAFARVAYEGSQTMSSADVQAPPATASFFSRASGEPAAESKPEEVSAFDAVMPESARGKERFIPVTRFALLDRLTSAAAWPAGQAKEARRFFRYLDYWRRQQYNAQLIELEQTYEPFSPDSDLLMTRTLHRGRARRHAGSASWTAWSASSCRPTTSASTQRRGADPDRESTTASTCTSTSMPSTRC